MPYTDITESGEEITLPHIVGMEAQFKCVTVLYRSLSAQIREKKGLCEVTGYNEDKEKVVSCSFYRNISDLFFST